MGSAGGRLRALAWLNIAVHIAAMALAAFGMRAGTAAYELTDRAAYLAARHLGWTLGWTAWALCALLDLAYIAALASRTKSPSPLATLAVVLVAAGAAIDLSCDTVHLTVLPLIARTSPLPVPLFLAAERAAWAVGAVVANGLYSAATLAVTVALHRQGALPRLAFGAGVATFAAGLGLAAAGFTGDPRHLEVASAPTIAAFILWVATTARALEPRRS